jgi:hypothetical protein
MKYPGVQSKEKGEDGTPETIYKTAKEIIAYKFFFFVRSIALLSNITDDELMSFLH